MNTTDNGRAEARSRANRRLRNITVGTTLAAVAATGGLGWLAAVTHPASATTTTAAAATTTGTTSAATTRSRNGTATTRAGTTVRSATGVAHASSGGS